MDGYWNEPEATAQAMEGTWLHTGDMAVWDEDRYILIVDRKKDIIISGGENISSIEIEKVIASHPSVYECAVIGVPHEKWGETPKAIVALKAGQQIDEDEIRAHVREHLAGFKVPSHGRDGAGAAQRRHRQDPQAQAARALLGGPRVARPRRRLARMTLFDPLELPRSGLRLANRLVMAPMPTFGAAADGSVGEAELAYYRRRAAGGVGAVITAGCAVAADGLAHRGQWRCDDDRFGDSLSLAAATIQQAGARAILQLEHAGGVHLVDEREAPRLLRCFREAACRARRAGFAGVALHGGHGELLQQFFSPTTNERPWRFGGPTAAQRSRFPQQAVLEACEGFQGPCWYRLPPHEPGGIRLEQTLDLAAALAQAGAEALEIGARRYDGPSASALSDHLRGSPAVVMAVGGISHPEQARQALADGCALVGLGRVLLAAPDWPARVAADPDAPADVDLSDHTKLEALDVPPTVIDYLRRRAREHRSS